MDLRSLRGNRPPGERRKLQEERRHGRPDLPVGLYRMSPGPGDPVLDMHWHSECEFLIMERGQALFQIGRTAYEARAGDVLFIPGEELHGGYWPKTKNDAPYCAYSAIVFDLDWLAGRSQDLAAMQWLLPLQSGELSLPQHLPTAHPAASSIYRLAVTLAAEETTEPSPGKALRLTGGLLTLFAEYADAGLAERQDPWNAARTGTPDQLLRVLTYMEKEFGRKLTVAQLARMAGMSEGHFSRLFRKYLRQPPIDYLNGIRLRRAAELLRQPGVTVSEAALSCGYDNFSYFSRTFRARFHCTPSEYRK